MDIKLHGNQEVVTRWQDVTALVGDTINIDRYKKALGEMESYCKFLSFPERTDNTSFFYDNMQIEYDANMQPYEAGVGNSCYAKKACHAKIDGVDAHTTYIANIFNDHPAMAKNYFLGLLSEDSPFASVTRDVSIVVCPKTEKILGIVFRNMNVPIKVLTNFLIWTRGINIFKSYLCLEQDEWKDLPIKTKLALSPLFQFFERDFGYGVGPGYMSQYGDNPTYGCVSSYEKLKRNHAGFYHPNDYLTHKVSDREEYTLRAGAAPELKPNPCNGFLSHRKHPFVNVFTGGVPAHWESEFSPSNQSEKTAIVTNYGDFAKWIRKDARMEDKIGMACYEAYMEAMKQDVPVHIVVQNRKDVKNAA